VLSTLNVNQGNLLCPTPFDPLLARLNIQNQPIPDSIVLSVGRAKALDDRLAGFHPDTKRFLHRILMAQFSLAAEEKETKNGYWDKCLYYLYVSSEYTKKTYHRIVSKELLQLEKLGVLKITGYKFTKGQSSGHCRGFRVVDLDLLGAFDTPITRETPKIFYNLSPQKLKSISDIARDAEKSIPTGVMNLEGVIGYIDRKSTQARVDWDYLMTELSYVLGCWHDRTNWDEGTGVLTYRQSYHTSDIGGRVYAKSGDALVSRALKKIWFDLPDVHNYDIKAAHVASFSQLYPTEFGQNWVKDEGFRGSIAQEIGVSVGVLKIAVLSLTYGGELRTGAYRKKGDDVFCTIFQAFVDDVGYDRALLAMEKFKGLTSEYITALNQWHSEIKKQPKKWQRNALGMVTTETNPKTLASHYLQGKEQEAIRWISSLHNQSRNGYRVISNQYDGVAAVGMIPDVIIERFTEKFKLIIQPKPIG
jgi:hypothetical protein